MPAPPNHLEPRVASIEAQLSTLTKDMGELVKAVHEQGAQIGALAIGVSAAQGPRKMEWGTMVSAIGLFLAIGAAALSPIYLRMADMQMALHENKAETREHAAMTLHPVGTEKIRALEAALAQSEAHVVREADLLRQTTNEKALMIQAQLETLRDKAIPPITERIAMLDQRMKEVEARNPQVHFQLQP